MTDTQGPRFIVFQQDRDDEPHRYDGSVHAPDSEMALLNARDVFTRRPACISLWIVRADQILARTAEEIASDRQMAYDDGDAGAKSEPYTVFVKRDHKGVHSYIGEVEAVSPASAMRLAIEKFSDDRILVWWVCPSAAIMRTKAEDIQALFHIAEPRFYRDQGEFHTIAALRKIKSHGA